LAAGRRRRRLGSRKGFGQIWGKRNKRRGRGRDGVCLGLPLILLNEMPVAVCVAGRVKIRAACGGAE
jgi:hypothetical protein